MDFGNFNIAGIGTNGDSDGDAGNAIVADFLGSGVGADNDAGSEPRRDSAGNVFDAGVHSGPDKFNADGSYRRKRGRRSGQSAAANPSRRNSGNKAGLEALSNTLLIIHVGIANATKTPELVLEEQEAQSLASAVNNVMTEFDFAPDPKIQAIVGLVVAAGSIYGPRAYLIRERRKGNSGD